VIQDELAVHIVAGLEDVDADLDNRRDESSRESDTAVQRYKAPSRRTSPNRELRKQFRGAQRRRDDGHDETQCRTADTVAQRRGSAPEHRRSHHASDESRGSSKGEKKSCISRVFDWL